MWTRDFPFTIHDIMLCLKISKDELGLAILSGQLAASISTDIYGVQGESTFNFFDILEYTAVKNLKQLGEFYRDNINDAVNEIATLEEHMIETGKIDSEFLKYIEWETIEIEGKLIPGDIFKNRDYVYYYTLKFHIKIWGSFFDRMKTIVICNNR